MLAIPARGMITIGSKEVAGIGNASLNQRIAIKVAMAAEAAS